MFWLAAYVDAQTRRVVRSRIIPSSHERLCTTEAMFAPDSHTEPDDAAMEQIYQRAPAGALAVAGAGTAVVFALWFAFYLWVFLPRGFLH